MKLKISNIVIGKRYRKDLGNISLLAESIQEVGLLHPVVIDDNSHLIAGQRRIESCKLLGWIEIDVTVVSLKDIVYGEFHENSVRQNFTIHEAVEIKKAIEPKIVEESKMRMSKGVRGGDSPQLITGKTRDKIAKFTGYSSNTLSRMVEIDEESKTNPKFEKLAKQIDDKNSKQTVNSVFKKLKKLNNDRIRKEKIKETQVVLPDTITLYNQEFQTAPIANSVVSLIFTDLPYHDEYLHLYKDLAKQAARVLKDGGSLVTYVGQHNIMKIGKFMEDEGLQFHWPLAIMHSGQKATMHSTKTMIGWKPMLWFTKGKYEGDYVRDWIDSKPPNKDEHEWAQSSEESDYYIKHMTVEGEIVYDPTMGSGTFGVSAKKLNRQFIGCEIDKEHFENARRIISIDS